RNYKHGLRHECPNVRMTIASRLIPPRVMDELPIVKELQRRIREAEKRAEKAEKEGQEHRQRAEKAEKERQEHRQRADEAEKEIRPTTINEYIAACHFLVFSSFNIERNWALTSKGAITNPRNKWCPTRIEPWSDFIQQQRITFGTIYDTFPTDSRIYQNRAFLSGLGKRVSMRSISDEKTLESFLHNSVEDPVKAIINQLKEVEGVKSAFNLGDGIIFENHPHAISDLAEEVVYRDTPSTPPATPNHNFDLNRLRPDQICVYRSDNAGSERRSMIYVSEYKPPHKLTAPHLRLGLRSMNIYKELVNRKIIPTSLDPDARFQYHAERLTAAAITQTYHYMIEGGFEYGFLTTGEAIVFLKINWSEPETLFYHLAEPGAEVLAHPNHLHLCTAVGQYLAFSLMALGMPGEQRLRGQNERHQATERFNTWVEDFETTLRSIPADERHAPSSSPGYQPETYKSVDRSPYFLRRRRRRRVGDDPNKEEVHKEPGESSDDESAGDLPETPSPTERRTRQGRADQGTRRSERILAQRPRGGDGGGSNEQDRPYCTQKCLLGLVKGGFLDAKCPNVALHNRQPNSPCDHDRGPIGSCIRHPINHAKFLDILFEQLKRSLDVGITPLGQGGARSVLFKVNLLEFGYTFVSKGTVRAFVKDLEHEAVVYKRLQPIQGTYVPVFLGVIDLRLMNRVYYYDHRVYIIHLTLLSWGGCDFEETGVMGGGEGQFEGKAMQSLHAIHQLGVAHKDIRGPNMLFNAEVNGVMIIDFERALLLEPPRPPLVYRVPNKRRWEPDVVESIKSTGNSGARGQASNLFSEDIWLMTLVLGAYRQ
ncbi:hypothetical protein MCOR25_010305, partial [Pyricularia grisea]